MDITQLIRTRRSSSEGRARSLDILFASSEVAPYSKTGGLADVAASFPKALHKRGHNVSVVTPLYGHLDPAKLHLARRLEVLRVPRQGRRVNKVEARVWEGRMLGGVRIFFLEQEEFFGREGIYGYESDEFADNAARYAFFSRAVVEFALQMSVPVDVLHCNDWHTALAPVYHHHYYDNEDDLGDVSTVLTIHNLAFQGEFDAEAFEETGLPKSVYLDDDELLHGDDTLNYLKGGIKYADRVTTVSPTYAEEIQTEEGGFGLHEQLQARGDELTGILNGADYGVWSPDADPYIPLSYDALSLNNKRRCKAELQHDLGLPVRPMVPMLAFIGRLTEQKGLDVLLPAVRQMLEGFENERKGFQLVLLGEGEERFADQIAELVEDFPRRVFARVGYDEVLAHRILAGSDMLLMPSRFEPCGLTQIYAMRYGTLPVVHATGGLNDTVVDREDVASSSGFVTEELSVDALVELIEEAMTSFRSYRSWRPQMVHAMEQDFSWKTSASQYEELYADSLGIELVEDAPEEAGEEQETPDEEAGEEQETPDEEASDEQGEGDDSDDDAQQAG